MSKVDDKLVGENIRPLKIVSVPHINPVEWRMRVSGNATSSTPHVSSETIPAAISARQFFAILAELLRRKSFMAQNFYEDAISTIQIFLHELVLSLIALVYIH